LNSITFVAEARTTVLQRGIIAIRGRSVPYSSVTDWQFLDWAMTHPESDSMREGFLQAALSVLMSQAFLGRHLSEMLVRDEG
jgi:hypothetical protein